VLVAASTADRPPELALLLQQFAQFLVGFLLLHRDNFVRIFFRPIEEGFGPAALRRALDFALYLVEDCPQLCGDVRPDRVVVLLCSFARSAARTLTDRRRLFTAAHLPLKDCLFFRRAARAGLELGSLGLGRLFAARAGLPLDDSLEPLRRHELGALHRLSRFELGARRLAARSSGAQHSAAFDARVLDLGAQESELRAVLLAQVFSELLLQPAFVKIHGCPFIGRARRAR